MAGARRDDYCVRDGLVTWVLGIGGLAAVLALWQREWARFAYLVGRFALVACPLIALPAASTTSPAA
jgi:hypothetical protein